jgi:hypothetical protein
MRRPIRGTIATSSRPWRSRHILRLGPSRSLPFRQRPGPRVRRHASACARLNLERCPKCGFFTRQDAVVSAMPAKHATSSQRRFPTVSAQSGLVKRAGELEVRFEPRGKRSQVRDEWSLLGQRTLVRNFRAKKVLGGVARCPPPVPPIGSDFPVTYLDRCSTSTTLSCGSCETPLMTKWRGAGRRA